MDKPSRKFLGEIHGQPHTGARYGRVEASSRRQVPGDLSVNVVFIKLFWTSGGQTLRACLKASSLFAPCRLITFTATWVNVQLSGFGSKLPNDLHDSAILDPITFPYITISSTCHWVLWDIKKLTSQVTDSARTGQFDLCAVWWWRTSDHTMSHPQKTTESVASLEYFVGRTLRSSWKGCSSYWMIRKTDGWAPLRKWEPSPFYGMADRTRGCWWQSTTLCFPRYAIMSTYSCQLAGLTHLRSADLSIHHRLLKSRQQRADFRDFKK